MKRLALAITVIIVLFASSILFLQCRFNLILEQGISIIELIKNEGLVTAASREKLKSSGWKIYREDSAVVIGKQTGFVDEEVIVRLIDHSISAGHYVMKSIDDIPIPEN